MITINKMESLLNNLAAELPEEFYKELNGGIILLPEAKLSDYSRGEDLYTMGEYRRDISLGRYIAIFYGSFIKVYGNIPDEQIETKLREVLRHEFRHHLESLSGEKDLEIEDEKFIDAYLNNYRGKK